MKKIIALLLVVAIAFGGWYFLSPPMALKGLRDAAAAHDADAVMDYVDLPALRASLKQQLKQRLTKEAASKTGLEAIGMQFGVAVADPVIDILLTEDNVADMIERQTLTGAALAAGSGAVGAAKSMDMEVTKSGNQSNRVTGNSATDAAALPSDAQEAKIDFEIRRVSLDEFRVYAKDQPERGEFIFRRHGIGWKLSGMELPEVAFPQL